MLTYKVAQYDENISTLCIADYMYVQHHYPLEATPPPPYTHTYIASLLSLWRALIVY